MCGVEQVSYVVEPGSNWGGGGKGPGRKSNPVTGLPVLIALIIQTVD